MRTKIILISIAAGILYAGGVLTGWWLHKPMPATAANWQAVQPVFVPVERPTTVADVKTRWLTRVVAGKPVVKTVTVEKIIEKNPDCKKCFAAYTPQCPAATTTRPRVEFNRVAVEAGGGLLNAATDAPALGYRAAVEYAPVSANVGSRGRVSLAIRADVQAVVDNAVDNAAITVGLRVEF